MKLALWVGAGGFLGSIGRYALELWVTRWLPPGWKFPWGTFVVNVSGCLAIGVLAGWIERRGGITPEMRLFLTTGCLGGFTTFSAFAWQGTELTRRGEGSVAAMYVVSSVGLGLLAAWAGFRIAAAR